MNWHKPSLDAWGNPRFLRCPVCAAALLNDADESLHAAWHARMEGIRPKKASILMDIGESLIDITVNGEMSLRTYNALQERWHGTPIQTVYELAEYTQDDLMRRRYFGIKALAEVAAVLKKRGISFKNGGKDFLRMECRREKDTA